MRRSSASSASQARRAAPLRGAKPSKQNFSAGRPDITSAVVTADGPGKHVTETPASMHAATSR
ncbi:Uncharacterised protein [Mycobacterium tuberculosis]|uniref:Uncharacterized protein n=1 Tax=Mycobacterium tuberculosis TaxID=1773 RepID=A0A655AP66_MYCTX|nr:Uncharacterised protein [Mycobacterium tuberculosis]CFR97552.1 Uncharacterised protein [Mycobacterium tuberculosis]CKP82712.1 Uncharacterised protein [Mycobacterium tuberculosis]CKR52684.1 Uncharacterised protein [Mycobacterium tuberculosis]CKS80284.1 Uncharacterised protein [Mycobacterium tuberculosis]